MCKFYGPSVCSLPAKLVPALEEYTRLMQFDFDFESSYLFCVGTDGSRNMSESQFCTYVKGVFAKHSPNKTPTPPSKLRSSFVTFLRSDEAQAAPEVLKSACRCVTARPFCVALGMRLARTEPYLTLPGAGL